MKIINVDASSEQVQLLEIGYQGENEVTQVCFDISAWQEAFGEGYCTIYIKRKGDAEPYYVELPLDENIATWTVSSVDTANKGNGSAQLNYFVDSVLKRTRIYPMKVAKSLVDSGDIPDPYDEWLEEIRQGVHTVEDFAESLTDEVNDWLIAHPEATTTVQDWSLNSKKLIRGTLGFVTPEMFGAAGDGITDDTEAFEDMFSSGEKIVIPANSYNLTDKIFEDDSAIISNDGTFPNGNLIISKNLGEAAPEPKVFKHVNFSDLNLGDVSFQSAAYDSSRDVIVLGFASTGSDSYLVAVSSDFSTVIGSSTITGYHLNDMTYNENTDRIYGATMDSSNQIAVINPQTLSVEQYLSVGYTVYEISYDEQNDIYYIVGNGKINIYDSQFALLKAYPFSTNEIADVLGTLKEGRRPEELVAQTSLVLDGQFCLVTNGTEYAKYTRSFLVQFNYKDGSVKKIYGWIPYGYSEEGETVIQVDGTLFALGHEPTPVRRMTITRLSLSEKVAFQPFSLLQDDENLILRTDRLSVKSERCEIVKGGYIVLGDFVFVQLQIKMLLAHTGTDGYWTLLEGFVHPEFYSVLSATSVAGGNRYTAAIDGGGALYIKHNQALNVGDEIYITGMYLRYLYNQGNR